MSYFLHIYACSHKDVADLLAGQSGERIQQLRAKTPAGNQAMLERLLNQDYERDEESLEGDESTPALLQAFEEVCAAVSPARAVVEFYLDEERFPELQSLVFDEWDDHDFGLPLSPDGTPAVIFRDARSLPEFCELFQARLASGDFDEDCISKPDLAELHRALESAVDHGAGAFIFCHQ